MQSPNHSAVQTNLPGSTQSLSLLQRLKRLLPYFGNQRLGWTIALVATLVGAATEPLMPALLKPLLDKGFTEGSLSLWMVPLFLIGLFFVRGLAQFCGAYALARIANACRAYAAEAGGLLAKRLAKERGMALPADVKGAAHAH